MSLRSNLSHLFVWLNSHCIHTKGTGPFFYHTRIGSYGYSHWCDPIMSIPLHFVKCFGVSLTYHWHPLWFAWTPYDFNAVWKTHKICCISLTTYMWTEAYTQKMVTSDLAFSTKGDTIEIAQYTNIIQTATNNLSEKYCLDPATVHHTKHSTHLVLCRKAAIILSMCCFIFFMMIAEWLIIIPDICFCT